MNGRLSSAILSKRQRRFSLITGTVCDAQIGLAVSPAATQCDDVIVGERGGINSGTAQIAAGTVSPKDAAQAYGFALRSRKSGAPTIASFLRVFGIYRVCHAVLHSHAFWIAPIPSAHGLAISCSSLRGLAATTICDTNAFAMCSFPLTTIRAAFFRVRQLPAPLLDLVPLSSLSVICHDTRFAIGMAAIAFASLYREGRHRLGAPAARTESPGILSAPFWRLALGLGLLHAFSVRGLCRLPLRRLATTAIRVLSLFKMSGAPCTQVVSTALTTIGVISVTGRRMVPECGKRLTDTAASASFYMMRR